ncbi:MAG: acetyl-CoA carboxylase, carboxyltransferase subunit beta [Pseudomonadota bacterium]
MNWLTNYVRPRIRALVNREESSVPENLWAQCPGCERMVFNRDLESNQRVCPFCSHHLRVTPEFRFETLLDAESWQVIELPRVPADPLKFRDKKRYDERLKDAQGKTGRNDAIVVAHGRIGGHPVVMAVMDFAFMGGSMGTAVGEALVTAGQLALLQRAALVVVTSSGGARMQEGALSLMQMARTTVAISELQEAGLPYITILADPTTGGVTASFAMLGDIAIAEPGAVIGFAGARVIEQTIRETLPEGFQRAEYLKDHGIVDMVVHRFDLPSTLGRVIDLLMTKEPPVTTLPVAPLGLEVVPAAREDDENLAGA